MPKAIGLSRSIKLPWLNKAAEFVSTSNSEQEYKDAINDYLSYEIKSPTVLRKTREILANTWNYNDVRSDSICMKALETISKCPDEAIGIHWALLLINYPVFVDICNLISKLSQFQDEITLKQLRQKMFDEWGERATLFHSLDKIIATMKYLEVLEAGKPGVYRIKHHKIKNQDVTNLLLLVGMKVSGNSYTRFQDLKDLSYLFPFEYTISKEQLTKDKRFILSNLGGELTMGIS